MLPGQMPPRQLSTNTDDWIDQPSKFGLFLTSNIRDMASFVFNNYRDPNNTKKFANPVVDITASSRAGVLFG